MANFAIHGRGTPGQRVGSYKSPFKSTRTSFHAEDGVVVVVNENTGEERTVRLADWKDRIAAFARGHDSPGITASDRRDLRELLTQMLLVAREAALQGDPYDEVVLADKLNERPSVSVSMARAATTRSGLLVPGADLARAANASARPRAAGSAVDLLLGAQVDAAGRVVRLGD